MRLIMRSGVLSFVARALALLGLVLAQLVAPAQTAWAAPTPSTTLTLPTATFIGEPVTFTYNERNYG